jgi:hypothetical protein
MSSLASVDPEFEEFDADQLRGEVVKRGPVAWIRLPMLNEALATLGLPAGGWVEIDRRQQVDARSEAARSLAQINETDPGQLVDYVHAAEATERLGEETVNGVRARHYRGTIELDDVVRNAPRAERPGVEANLDVVRRGTGKDRLPIDVWIGDQALIHRIRLVYDFKRNPETGAGRLNLKLIATADLSDFGRRVVARPPPESNVVTVAELVDAAE